jgi:sulfur-carrier protein adenylyltransferase/sulfurtransferase
VPAPGPGARNGRGPPRKREANPPLTELELHRYSRHLLLPEVGEEGQRRLKASSVLIVGAGGLGAPAALYLAAAGVGVLGIAEFDRVDLSNLQRQVLYGSRDVGRPKLDAAEARLGDLNPSVKVQRHDGGLDPENVERIVRNYDVVIDGTDNFPARYLINDACVSVGRPDVFGSVYRFEGQVSVFQPPKGPCYRCLFPEPPPPEASPSCGEAGVLGVLPGLVGILQATESLKILLGRGQPLVGRLLLLDALEMRFKELKVTRDRACARCSPKHRHDPIELVDASCATAPGGAVAIPEVTPEELKVELSGASPPVLVDVREPGEYAINRIPGARLIPVGELAKRTGELRRSEPVVLYCKMGGRSARAARTLLDLGFTRVRNLRGGIDAWADRVDPTLVRY